MPTPSGGQTDSAYGDTPAAVNNAITPNPSALLCCSGFENLNTPQRQQQLQQQRHRKVAPPAAHERTGGAFTARGLFTRSLSRTHASTQRPLGRETDSKVRAEGVAGGGARGWRCGLRPPFGCCSWCWWAGPRCAEPLWSRCCVFSSIHFKALGGSSYFSRNPPRRWSGRPF